MPKIYILGPGKRVSLVLDPYFRISLIAFTLHEMKFCFILMSNYKPQYARVYTENIHDITIFIVAIMIKLFTVI